MNGARASQEESGRVGGEPEGGMVGCRRRRRAWVRGTCGDGGGGGAVVEAVVAVIVAAAIASTRGRMAQGHARKNYFEQRAGWWEVLPLREVGLSGGNGDLAEEDADDKRVNLTLHHRCFVRRHPFVPTDLPKWIYEEVGNMLKGYHGEKQQGVHTLVSPPAYTMAANAYAVLRR